MAYSEIAPAAALRPWVECFWTHRDDAPSGAHRVLPDGCADLVFDLTNGDADVVGTMTRPLVIPPAGPSHAFGVRFRPGRAAAFLKLPIAELTDARVPLRDIWRSWDGQIDIGALETELLKRLDPDRDRRVDAAVATIVATAGNARIDELAQSIGISRQHLARQFQHHVGLSPKAFARVMRFRRLIDTLGDRADIDWADAAAEHGYADQSHLIREFRELAGTTPSFHFFNR